MMVEYSPNERLVEEWEKVIDALDMYVRFRAEEIKKPRLEVLDMIEHGRSITTSLKLRYYRELG